MQNQQKRKRRCAFDSEDAEEYVQVINLKNKCH